MRRTKLFENLGRELVNVSVVVIFLIFEVKHEMLKSSTDAVMKKYFTAMAHARCLPQNNENRLKVVIAIDDAHVLRVALQVGKYLATVLFPETVN